MSSITVKMKDGSVRHFPHVGRAGGSYTKRIAYEGGFAVITDEWDNRTAIPAADIAAVYERPDRDGY
jgi:hypothetical protein